MWCGNTCSYIIQSSVSFRFFTSFSVSVFVFVLLFHFHFHLDTARDRDFIDFSTIPTKFKERYIKTIEAIMLFTRVLWFATLIYTKWNINFVDSQRNVYTNPSWSLYGKRFVLHNIQTNFGVQCTLHSDDANALYLHIQNSATPRLRFVLISCEESPEECY